MPEMQLTERGGEKSSMKFTILESACEWLNFFVRASPKAIGSNQCCPQVFRGICTVFDPMKSWQIQMTITI